MESGRPCGVRVPPPLEDGDDGRSGTSWERAIAEAKIAGGGCEVAMYLAVEGDKLDGSCREKVSRVGVRANFCAHCSTRHEQR